MSTYYSTPNMNLTVPVPTQQPGPDWSFNLNGDLTLLDVHNHTTGKGVQIPTAGLNINADLTFNGFNATALRTSRYTVQSAALSGVSDLACVYAAGMGGDLYFNDGAGNQVRITQGGSVAGSTGTITGLPSGTASASYSSIATSFIFQQATSTAAIIDGASFVLRNTTASSFGLTLNPPNAMGFDYSVTLPPTNYLATTCLINYDVAQNMGLISYDGVAAAFTSVGANAIASTMTSTGADAIAATMSATGANAIASTMTTTGCDSIGTHMSSFGADTIAATMTTNGTGHIVTTMAVSQANQVIGKTTKPLTTGSGSGVVTSNPSSVTTSSTSIVAVASITLTTSGRPVMIMVSAGSGGFASCSTVAGAFTIKNDTTATTLSSSTIGANLSLPVSLTTIDAPAAGSYQYTVYVNCTSGGGTFIVSNYKIIAYELS